MCAAEKKHKSANVIPFTQRRSGGDAVPTGLSGKKHKSANVILLFKSGLTAMPIRRAYPVSTFSGPISAV